MFTRRTTAIFSRCQEDLILRIMDIVADSGASFAFPSQTLYMAKDQLPPEENRLKAEDRVHQWCASGELQLPRFETDRIAALKGTLAYPSDGSAAHAAAASKQADHQPPSEKSKAASPKNFWKWSNHR